MISCFLSVLLLIPNISFANVLCSKDGYTIATLNGINTTDDEAKVNMKKLKQKFGLDFADQKVDYQYLLNQTHLGGAKDVADVFVQDFFHTQSDYDLIEMLRDASNKITTQKLLLVGHSQGNFYANNFYQKVADQRGGIPKESIRVYAVATPSNTVAGNPMPLDWEYTTSDTDKVISAFAKLPLTSSILRPNVHIELKDGDNIFGHDFTEIYLKYQAEKIISDLGRSLNKLKTNDIQNENEPCITPPEITALHKTIGNALVFIDHPFDTLKDSAIYIANGVHNTFSAIASLFINNDVALNNSASTIIATNQEQKQETQENSPQNVIVREPKKETKKPAQEIISEPAIEISQNTEPTISTSNANQVVNNTASLAPVPIILFGGAGGDNPPDPTPPVPPDTTPPIISINSNDSVDVVENTTYVDAGATALDDVDGTISVITTGAVNTSIVGTYTIIYTATDIANNITTLTRTVNVIYDDSNLSPSDLNVNGIADLGEAEVIVSSDTSLSAGEYRFNNLIITNNATLTLVSNPSSVNSFKGVKIRAANLNINSGSFISADKTGFGFNVGNFGPGAPPQTYDPDNPNPYYFGASYGGIGFGSNVSYTYGSSTEPIDLGSSGNVTLGIARGGGAIKLIVSDTFTNDGVVSSGGGPTASGGSIYVTTNTFTGSGTFQASGGEAYYSSMIYGAGGGGRIALYYQISSFTGIAVANGWNGTGGPSTAGTVILDVIH